MGILGHRGAWLVNNFYSVRLSRSPSRQESASRMRSVFELAGIVLLTGDVGSWKIIEKELP